ncbi:unnamed protein product [Peniophora sp. CBMAI 1063]|nr:unnamed protein product [Peniophora sp. CBMAI 1063]
MARQPAYRCPRCPRQKRATCRHVEKGCLLPLPRPRPPLRLRPSDVANPSELTLVADLSKVEDHSQKPTVPALDSSQLPYSETSISGTTMNLPARLSPQEFYWTDSPPITYSPGPLKFYVPVELFQLILENIDQYTGYYVLWRNLRLVSRAWNYEADRFFFRDLGIADGHFVDFASALLATPWRARHIRALYVDWAQDAPGTPEHLDIIRRAFMIMPNLETLRERYSHCRHQLLVSDGSLIMKGMPFRLRTWVTSFRWCPQLEEILLEQTELRKFQCDADLSFGTAPPEQRLVMPGMLPKCELLDAGAGILETFQNVGDAPAVRHLTFRIVCLQPERELGAAIGPRFIGSQLTSLVISRHSIQRCAFTPMPELVREFIASVPNLLLFGVIDYQFFTPRDNAQLRTMICDHLPHLKTFVWAQDVYGIANMEDLDDEDMEGDDVESDESEDESEDDDDGDDDDEEGGPAEPRRRLHRHAKFGLYARKLFADHPALEFVTAFFHYRDHYGLSGMVIDQTQSLYKRVRDDKLSAGYTVVENNFVHTITSRTCDLIDPKAPEDYLLRCHVNPNRFLMPNPALPVLSTDSDSD